MQADLDTLFAYFDKEAKNFSGHFGLAAQRVDATEPILYHADDLFPLASVIKLVVLAEYLAQVAVGQLKPNQRLTLKAEDQVEGAGVLKDLQPGLQLTLQDIAILSTTISDNTAANLLIEQVGGLARINARLQALDMHNTSMDRSFIFDSTADNTGTPADFLHLLLRMAQGQLVNPTISQQMVEILGHQQYLEYIPRYLPFHPFAAEYNLPQTITIANKVGMLRGVVNDAAVITTPDFTYVLVIFTRGCRDTRPDPDNEAALLVARLSKQIYDYFLRA